MAKSHDSHKNKMKAPQKTADQKRQEKRDKKNKKPGFSAPGTPP
jgi:hypothetical protein